MKELAGKTALVTGGASGIGLGIARSFAVRGMKLVLADVEEGALDAAAKTIRDLGAEVLPIRLDVRDRAAFATAGEAVERRFGPLHVLCNNAGVSSGENVVSGSWDDWEWELGVNWFGVLHGVRTLVPRMLAHREPSHVVNTASMGGMLPGSALGIYSTTKFAVVGLSESLRLELRDTNVGVSVLCPGMVRTRIAEAARNREGEDGAHGKEVKRGVAMGIAKGMDPDRVGERVVDGILADAPWIMTHPEYREPVRRRFEGILAALDGEPGTDARLAQAYAQEVERLRGARG